MVYANGHVDMEQCDKHPILLSHHFVFNMLLFRQTCLHHYILANGDINYNVTFQMKAYLEDRLSD